MFPLFAAPFRRSTAGERDVPVRRAQCAGLWYPADGAQLAATVDEYLDGADTAAAEHPPIAIIAPHAGYRYSGRVAAAGYAQLRNHEYHRVIVLAFSHRLGGSYSGIDVPEQFRAYETPLGRVPIDREACDILLQQEPFCSIPGVDQGEHALELQLPFLQRMLREWRLLPLHVGNISHDEVVSAARALLPWLDGRTLIIVSSDFTHFGPGFGYEPFTGEVESRLRQLADDAAAPILNGDPDGFQEHLDDTKDTICGRQAIQIMLRTLSMRGGAQGIRAELDFSGRMTRDWSSCVTYQSLVLAPRSGTLDRQARTELLRLARHAAASYLRDQPPFRPDPESLPSALRANAACFITLQNRERLRGCIGNMAPSFPLHIAACQNAVAACQDPRFVDQPITAAEIDELDVSISVLSEMKPITDVREIIVGRHGLVVAMGACRGVLLPQVAYERGWTRYEFLAQTCRKAGLPLDAWKQPGAEIQVFEAEVIGKDSRS